MYLEIDVSTERSARATRRSRFALSLLALVPALAHTGPSRADAVVDFYKGRTVTIVVGYSAGGGYDLYARALARHFGEHIPGHPTVVVSNMPGAGSVAAANYLYNVAAKDGTVLGTFSRGIPMEPLVGNANVRYETPKFTWIGSASNELSVCALSPKAPVKSWAEALERPFTVAGEGPGSDPDTYAKLVQNLFGAKLKLVTGYPGGNEMTLAVERGEVDGRCGWSWGSIKATRPDWAAGDQKLNVLIQLAVERSPELPEVPTAFEIARDERQRNIVKLIVSRQVLARPFAAPPGIPDDRKEALRKAFDATMTDPDFLKEGTRSGLEINPVSGGNVDKLIAELYATPKEIVEQARATITGEPAGNTR
jgi:tripartite-type tricarboxylate transporter receptor subunit TctC